MLPGVHDGLTGETYHASPGISKSGLAAFADCPARFRHGEPIRTRSMAIGSLIHTAILEPDQLPHRYQVSELRQFNDNHKAYQAEQRAALGRELVKRADYEEALRVRDAVMRNPDARALIGPDEALIIERSFAWHDPATGTLCRGRADAINPRLDLMADLKSTKDARAASFARDAHTYRYHWQVPMYTDGMAIADAWRPARFLFVVVEPVRPYLTAAYEIEPRGIAQGRIEVAQALRDFAKAVQTNTWRGLPQGIQTLELPAYAYPSP